MPTPSSTARMTPAPHSPGRASSSPPTRRRWANSPPLPRALGSAHEERALGRGPMTRKQRRAVFIVLTIGVLSLAVLLVAVALRDTIVFFHTPKEVAEKGIPSGKRI